MPGHGVSKSFIIHISEKSTVEKKKIIVFELSDLFFFCYPVQLGGLCFKILLSKQQNNETDV